MRSTLTLLAACCLALPAAAQTTSTVPPPAKRAVAGKATANEAATEAAVANKIAAVNKVDNGSTDLAAFDSRARSLRGSPFLMPGWTPGEITASYSVKPMPGTLKFDVLNQEVYLLRPRGDSIVLGSNDVQAFKMRFKDANGQAVERSFERLPPTLIPRRPASYAEVVVAGPTLQLLKYHGKALVKGQTVASYGNTTPVDVFQNTQQYYLRWADGTHVPVKPSKSSILSAVAERHAAAVQDELKDKSKARTDAELAALVQRVDAALARK